jgi:4a-hydroxytetrahydrobiopterin dehydratase
LRLKKDQIKAEQVKLMGWKLVGKQITKVYVFENFKQGMRFLNRVARLAEAMNHHPDIDIRYNKIRLILTTHDEGGLTRKDFKLASEIDRFKAR